MNEHVLDRIADVLEGRLDEGRMRECRRHLDACAECAADFAWAREFRERAFAQGMRHLTPERILALASGEAASAASEEQAHLTGCPSCRSELEWARNLSPLETLLSLLEPKPEPKPEPKVEPKVEQRVAAMPEPVVAAPSVAMPSAPPAKRPSVPGVLWGAAALALAVVVFVMVLALPGRRKASHSPASATQPATQPATVTEPELPPPPVPTLASLARFEPLPPRFTRQGEEPGSFDEVRALGLDAYGIGAYEVAAEHLRRAVAMRSRDDEIRLYLASAELMLRNPNAALPLLETVTVTSDDPGLVADALWQLANAWLLLEDREEALATIRRLSQRGGPHAGAAETLRAEIERMAGAR